MRRPVHGKNAFLCHLDGDECHTLQHGLRCVVVGFGRVVGLGQFVSGGHRQVGAVAARAGGRCARDPRDTSACPYA